MVLKTDAHQKSEPQQMAVLLHSAIQRNQKCKRENDFGNIGYGSFSDHIMSTFEPRQNGAVSPGPNDWDGSDWFSTQTICFLMERTFPFLLSTSQNTFLVSDVQPEGGFNALLSSFSACQSVILTLWSCQWNERLGCSSETLEHSVGGMNFKHSQ